MSSSGSNSKVGQMISGEFPVVDFTTQVQIDLDAMPSNRTGETSPRSPRSDRGVPQTPTIGEFVLSGGEKLNGFDSKDELLRILTAIRLASKIVSREVNKAGLSDFVTGSAGKVNVQGEEQTTLDVFANKLFVQCLRNRNIVCGLVSEEEDVVIQMNEHHRTSHHYIVLMDPLDGSSNVDVNISVGTIFSVVRRKTPANTNPEASDFLQDGNNIIAAGYVLYGSSTMLVFSVGQGVHGFTLDPSIGTLYLTHPNMQFPKLPSPSKGIYSVNEGNYKSFSKGVQAYLDRCKDRQQTARYVGSLVADFHRNLLKGGIYMYPPTAKDKQGKLRLLYECNPIAFLAEQAGGKASTGHGRVMDVKPSHIHERVPFFVGPKEMVEELEECIKQYA
jgi:fructose-1,6-bisphosphatase I